MPLFEKMAQHWPAASTNQIEVDIRPGSEREWGYSIHELSMRHPIECCADQWSGSPESDLETGAACGTTVHDDIPHSVHPAESMFELAEYVGEFRLWRCDEREYSLLRGQIGWVRQR